MGGKRTGKRKHLFLYLACSIIMIGVMAACGKTVQVNPKTEGNALEKTQTSSSGDRNSLKPSSDELRDEELYREGLLLAHPWNMNPDYEKSMECFQSVITEFPESHLRLSAQAWILALENILEKNHQIETLTSDLTVQEKRLRKGQKENSRLKNQIKDLKSETQALQQRIEALKKQIETLKIIDLGIEKKRMNTKSKGK